ncbi:ABC transporter permease DevC [Capilliphycus salinus ALCB114379]|uniref:ABC transporter permease DevC n=1 Tax=Capilliphycus salinus TaxID=2768948 RepID=UPI0039A7646E
MKLLQQLQRRTSLGWLQLTHSKSRLLVAIAGIAFADVLMFMQLGFQESLYDSNTRMRKALNADIVLVSPKAKNTQNLSTFSRRRLYQAMDVPGVESAHALYSQTINWKNPQTREDNPLQLIGFDPNYEAFNIPELNQQLDEIKIPDVVLFDRQSRGDYDQVIAEVSQGNWVSTEAEGRKITVKGLFSLGASFGTDGVLMTSDQNFLMLFRRRDAGSISLGLIHVEPEADSVVVAEALRSHLPEDVEVMTMAEFIEDEQKYWQEESPIGFIFTLGTAMAFIVGVVIVYQILSTDVSAHIQEYATFKAMGYRHRYLLAVVFEEAIILAFLGFIPGFVLPIGLYHVAAKATSLPIFMTEVRAITVLILTIIMCMMSGGIATQKLKSADPADMF